VAYQLTLIRGRIEQRGDLGFGQLLSWHHLCLPGIPEAGRPADPGEEVDQGGALEAEGAADRGPAGAAVSGAPSDRPRKTVTDSARLSSWFVRLCVKSGRSVTSGQMARAERFSG